MTADDVFKALRREASNRERLAVRCMERQRSLPLAPLWAYAEAVSGKQRWDPEAPVATGESFTAQVAAEMFGTTARTVQRWKARGRVPLEWADRIAVALGVHPVELWGDLWLDDTGRLFDQLRAEVSR